MRNGPDASQRARWGLRAAARALRTLALCLLVASVSGVLPVAGTCLETVQGCGDMCKRCQCKRRPASGSLRAPCVCCSSQPAAQPLTLLDPAVLADVGSSVPRSADARVDRDATDGVPSLARPVPHPPPRPFPLA